jgi:hypothetical protein
MSTLVIESTTDYSVFEMVEGNRDITEQRVKHWLDRADDLREFGAHFPAVVKRVGKKLHVFDGQGRIEACKRLGLPVHYTTRQNISVEDIHRIQGGRQWSIKDHGHSRAVQGQRDYQVLQKYVADTGMPHTCAMMVLSNNLSHSGNSLDAFRKGEFKAKSVKAAYEVAAILGVIREFSKVANDRSYIVAAIQANRTGKLDIERLRQKLVYQSRKLVKCATWQQALDVIDEIYDFNCKPSHLACLAAEVKKLGNQRGGENKAA